MKHTEVELKFRLLNHDDLRRRLQKAGAILLGSEQQVDTYYNAPHRDFLAKKNVSEWLRVRDEAGRSSLTYKLFQPVDAEVKTHCDEYETTLGEAVHKLLQALDFTELIIVDKQREEWRLGDVVVALDTVKDLGSFVEFEYQGNNASTVAEARTIIEDCIESLDAELGETHTGYPHQLIALRHRLADDTRD